MNSRTEKLRALMRLPWTVVAERNDEEGYLVARVVELPDAIATGVDDRALGRDLWASMWSSLSCRMEYGDPIPLPAGVTTLPWDEEGALAPRIRRVVGKLGSAWDVEPVAAGGAIAL